MLALLPTVASYRLSLLHHPDLAFAQLVFSWSSLFFMAYRAAYHMLTPGHALSLKVLRAGSTENAIEEWANRTASSLHALLACIGCVHWVVADSHLIKKPSDFGFLSSAVCDFYMGVTLGYLLFDILRMSYFRFFVQSSHAVTSAPVTSMFIHHATIIAAYSLGVRYHYGTYYMGLLLNNEITTPFLNARFLMAERGYKASKAYKVNELAFIAGFFVSRVVGNLYILYHMQTHLGTFKPVADTIALPTGIFYLLPVLAYAHALLQFYWFGLLMRMVYRKQRYGRPVSTVPSPSDSAPSKTGVPVEDAGSRAKALQGIYDPPIGQTAKSYKILGLPPAGLTGKTIRKLGLVEVANEKAAEVLGLRNTSSPTMQRRKRTPSAAKNADLDGPDDSVEELSRRE
ncbi:TLC domain-containing protein [Phlyctochytrium arcticum]|nr:TLC domain-containing protein [Phlyctochytrium arcticum]